MGDGGSAGGGGGGLSARERQVAGMNAEQRARAGRGLAALPASRLNQLDQQTATQLQTAMRANNRPRIRYLMARQDIIEAAQRVQRER